MFYCLDRTICQCISVLLWKLHIIPVQIVILLIKFAVLISNILNLKHSSIFQRYLKKMSPLGKFLLEKVDENCNLSGRDIFKACIAVLNEKHIVMRYVEYVRYMWELGIEVIGIYF